VFFVLVIVSHRIVSYGSVLEAKQQGKYKLIGAACACVIYVKEGTQWRVGPEFRALGASGQFGTEQV
jgi:hypothetical protein